MGLLTESALLTGLFDYAGLFPPAGLPMADAVAGFERYRAGKHCRMLNAFVIPAARLVELKSEVTSAAGSPWRLSVLSGDWPADRECIEQFRQQTAGFQIVSVETRQLSAAAEIRHTFPVYIELPLDDGLSDSVASLSQVGACAKIRTGGLTTDAFPTCEAVARFLTVCCQAGVPFKATAGLHHPLRSLRRTTAAADAPLAMMHGFVNVLGAVAAATNGATIEQVTAVLDNTQAAPFVERLTTRPNPALRHLFHSIGSCSFEEPVADLQELSWL
ncbi:MAG: hypothetical protein NXI04_01900 [Planctomycetaceae bacterium]|nr:hypothetical protein [Planctomycetaceae bacterium]